MTNKEEILSNRILELELTIKEAINAFDRETHQIDMSFPKYTAMQRMKRAVGIFDLKNAKVRTVANKIKLRK